MALTRLGLNQSINLATNVTGTLATGNGGTGATSFAPGKILQTQVTATMEQVHQEQLLLATYTYAGKVIQLTNILRSATNSSQIFSS